LVRATFDRVLELALEAGPFTVIPEKTRIAFHARMSFAAFVTRIHWLNGHVVLAERLVSPRFTRVETYSPRNVLHAFRLRSPADADDEVANWLRLAYVVGQQRHLSR
jgi:hypothetical protein